MNDQTLSQDQLIERINELEMLNQQLLKEKEQETRLDYAWTGHLGHWYWNIKTNRVTFNSLKVTVLGYDETEIPESVGYEYFTEKVHPDDLDKTMKAMKDHLYGKAGVYEVEYRIRAKGGDYKWYYDRGKITRYDKDGKPVFLAGVVFDITRYKDMQLELEYKNKILEEQSAIDGLTGLNNHRTLIERLTYEIIEAGHNKQPLCLIIFDIDDFKRVNDLKGHIVGDSVLADVAAIIKGNIRLTDFAGRYGGEEFMVVLPNTQTSVAKTVAERIRQKIESHGFDCEMLITISGGVKEYQGEQLHEFIDAADKKMYEAKRQGKNRIIV